MVTRIFYGAPWRHVQRGCRLGLKKFYGKSRPDHFGPSRRGVIDMDASGATVWRTTNWSLP